MGNLSLPNYQYRKSLPPAINKGNRSMRVVSIKSNLFNKQIEKGSLSTHVDNLLRVKSIRVNVTLKGNLYS